MKKLLVLTILLVLFVAACGIPAGIIVKTVIAEVTSVSEAVIPTEPIAPTEAVNVAPVPSNTPIPPPTLVPREDLQGSRDLKHIPRPPSGIIVGFSTGRRSAEIYYEITDPAVNFKDVRQFYLDFLLKNSWKLVLTSNDVLNFDWETDCHAPYEDIPSRVSVVTMIKGGEPTIYIYFSICGDVSDWNVWLVP